MRSSLSNSLADVMARVRLADRFVLRPTTDPVESNGKDRREVPSHDGFAEVWISHYGIASGQSAELMVLKFSGAGGRAERAGGHPVDVWSDIAAEVWAVNPPGYGRSPGPATLRRCARAARTVFDVFRAEARGRPILLVGNSLGAAVVLYLAARFPVAGVLVRNPPPLRELIVWRHGWWNLWLPAAWVARGVPEELDSIQNARRASAPALFVVSEADEVVPRSFQARILRAYSGENRVFEIPRARHHTPIERPHYAAYFRQLCWLRDQVLPDREKNRSGVHQPQGT